MSVQELETAVTQLPKADLQSFAEWFEEYLADAWDQKIEADLLANKLDVHARKANADFEAGRCTAL